MVKIKIAGKPAVDVTTNNNLSSTPVNTTRWTPDPTSTTNFVTNDIPGCSPFFSQYYAMQRYYEQKYGPKTVIVIRNGATYNIYEYSPEHDTKGLVLNELEGDASIILNINDKYNKITENATQRIDFKKNIGKAIILSKVLNVVLTSSTKAKPHGPTNPFMIGFPHAAYSRYRYSLLNAQYTIVLVDETGTSDKMITRNIMEIVSTGVDLDSAEYTPTSARVNQGLACLYIEYQDGKKNMDRTLITAGLSYINVIDGENVLYEVHSRENDETYVIHEMYRFLSCMSPAHVVIYLNEFPKARLDEYKKYFTENLNLLNYEKYSYYDVINKDYLKIDYQEGLLSKVFPLEMASNTTILTNNKYNPLNIFERLNVESLTYGRISYILMLMYCYEHRPELIQGLPVPKTNWLHQSQRLVLMNNAIDQLNLLSNLNNFHDAHEIKYDSIISVLDQCTTDMGSRFLKRRLLDPITDINNLQQYYDMTQYFMENNEFITTIHKHLKNIPDIERLQRLAKLLLIKPAELTKLIRGYNNILMLHDLCSNTEIFKPILMSLDKYNSFKGSVNLMNTMFNLEILPKSKFRKPTKYKPAKLFCEQSFINSGVYEQVDNIVKQTTYYWQYLIQICEHFNAIVGRKTNIKPQLDQNDKKDKTDDEETPTSTYKILITSTKAQSNTICTSPQLNVQMVGQLQTAVIKANVMSITSPIINECCTKFEYYNQMLEGMLLDIYQNVIKQLSQVNFMAELNRFVANIDFVHNNARVALRNKYFRPEIKPGLTLANDDQVSYIKAQDLRHPLIEQISLYEYVPIDVEIGSMLLYGVNTSGKSSAARAIGAAIIMAQSGMFVAGKIQYYPYTKIIARLSGNDDLLKGHSSFMVEMYELSIILKNADHRSLILGDELSRGTETGSGTGLTVATVEQLCERHSSFLFSTHMHHLCDMANIKQLSENKGLKICHLTAKYDPEIEMMVYDRKIKPGSGSSLYGLEVCKSLRFAEDFLQRAQDIRSKYIGMPDEMYSTKKSNYDGKLYVDKCMICSSTIDLVTHHIEEQHLADKDGFIGYYHKDSRFNIMILCEKCHKSYHSGEYQIIRKQVNAGTILQIEK